MTPTDAFGPQLARLLRQQRIAGLESVLAEQQALQVVRGGVVRSRPTADRRRVAQAFVGEGAELCGCGEQGCHACEASHRCACGKVSCAFAGSSTTPVLRRLVSGARWVGFGALPLGGSGARHACLGPIVIGNPAAGIDPVGPLSDDLQVRLLDEALDELTTTFAGDYFDTHSHNFMSTYADWMQVVSRHAPGTATYERIGWLATFASHGVGKMVISGMVDSTSGADPVADSFTTNLITSYAAGLHPDFFVPFVQVLPGEIDSSAASLVAAMLAAGFEGVGELIVHGHGTDINDNSALIAIGRVAAPYGAPMQMHWEFGNVTDWSVRTPAENFTQLLAFLDAFPNLPVSGYFYSDPADPIPLKVILCHCGAGPSWPQPPDVQAAWEERLLYLLKTYVNVYFDLAGMQVTTGGELYNKTATGIQPLGAFLLDCIASYPTRFLLGYDTETRYATDIGSYRGVATYIKSIPNYEDFLAMESFTGAYLTDAQKGLVRAGNAFNVLYVKPTSLSASASASASVHVGP